MKALFLTLLLVSLALAQDNSTNSSSNSSNSSDIFLNETFYTGYVPLEDRGSIWYWLFESRGDPATDPLIVFWPGGPGHTAAFAVLGEMGPYRVNNDSGNTTLSINPYSWNNDANVLFVDAPIGTGFSEALSNDSYALNQTQFAEDFLVFLQGFLVQHPEYNGRDFYLAGEAASARAIPILANLILDNSTDLNMTLKGIHLSAFLIDDFIQYSSWPVYAFVNALINGTLEDELNGLFDGNLTELYLNGDNATAINLGEGLVWGYIFPTIAGDFSWNPFNVKQGCYQNWTDLGCYDTSYVNEFILQPDVIEALNVTTADSWSFGNDTVYDMLNITEAERSSLYEISKVLQRGFPLVFVTGKDELIWNTIGAERALDAIPWLGQDNFTALNFTAWDDIGDYKTLDNLTFVRVNDSGHFVASDQPAASLAIINRLIDNEGVW